MSGMFRGWLWGRVDVWGWSCRRLMDQSQKRTCHALEVQSFRPQRREFTKGVLGGVSPNFTVIIRIDPYGDTFSGCSDASVWNQTPAWN